ncbi:TetR/AcrR family transcriptional regulator [Streptomyces glaucosporus]|uniref:TetR/AcrR family transcriptional regulator n=1 Tax=Streptomyces glaucosporus TaxID=284044 RepID=A0ABP5V366_9ACTN
MAPRTTRPTARGELIADTAIDLLAERGLRGLTHRAVDEAAGLPQGSTSNHARTREALLEAAVRRLAVREARVLGPREMPAPEDGPDALADALARALHRYLTRHRHLAVARYELALEATRRPALRAIYDRAGTAAFREPLVAMMAAAGSADPERHTLSLVAWCDGVMFSCTAGSYHSTAPAPEDLRAGLGELLRGMLGP